jgi:hypothetical protein
MRHASRPPWAARKWASPLAASPTRGVRGPSPLDKCCTTLQARAPRPMSTTPSRRKPTCRTSNSLNLSERRSPTWSNGRYRPRSPSPASACGRKWVSKREAYRTSDTIASRLRLQFLDCCLVTLHCSPLFRQSSAIYFSFAPLKPRNTHLHTCAFALCDLLLIRLSAFVPAPRTCRHCVSALCFISHGEVTPGLVCNTNNTLSGSRGPHFRLHSNHEPSVCECVDFAMGEPLQWRSRNWTQLLYVQINESARVPAARSTSSKVCLSRC